MSVALSSTRKGDLSKACVVAELMRRGFTLLNPLSEDSRYDIAVDICGDMKRIQVKTVYFSKSEKAYRMKFYSVRPKRKYSDATPEHYTEEDIDFFICYNTENGDLFVFPVDAVKDKWAITYHSAKKHGVNVEAYKNAFHLIGEPKPYEVKEREKPSPNLRCPSVEIECHTCGIKMMSLPSRLKRNNGVAYCSKSCYGKNITSKPTKEQLIEDIKEFQFDKKAIAGKYDVSSNTVSRWIRANGLPRFRNRGPCDEPLYK